MNEQYKAKPTTFNGVLYKSKSEAKLAVCLDAWGWDFSYETVAVGNWKADFTVKSKENSITIIEYKPTNPTQDYLRDLSVNFSKILAAAKANPLLRKATIHCELWVVDFWNNAVDGLRFFGNGSTQPAGHLYGYDFSPGKQFRFDLRSSSQTYDYTHNVTEILERMRRNKNANTR